MALSFSALTNLPTPPQRTDPDNFASRADAFVEALDAFQLEMNTTITELNTITSGLDQQSTIIAWSAVTTYDFPDVVAGSDGNTYRCIDTGVLNEDPTTDDGTYWLSLTNAFPVETGSIQLWSTDPSDANNPYAIPTGYLECDGSAVSRVTYSGLFAVISTTYGVGDGSTTFNLPDLRGQFVRGFDNGATVDPDAGSRTNRGDTLTGDAIGTKQACEVESHAHAGVVNLAGTSWGLVGGSTEGLGSTSAYGGNETRPTNVAMMFIIKY